MRKFDKTSGPYLTILGWLQFSPFLFPPGGPPKILRWEPFSPFGRGLPGAWPRRGHHVKQRGECPGGLKVGGEELQTWRSSGG